MAVELRCPECRAKLRLEEAPDEGTEVECPKCGKVFPAPGSDEDRPKKKPAAADDEDRPARPDRDGDEDRPRKKGGKGKKAAGDKKDQPKRRRIRKQKTNPAVLVGVIVGGLMLLGMVVTVLVWFLGRKPAAFEMMTYLPDDTHSVVGLNVTHVQKFPEFFKQVEAAYANRSFKKAADAVSKALGTETNDFLDYVVYAQAKSGDVIVLRSKKDFDPSGLSKMPGAKEYSAEGQKYYVTGDIDGSFRAPRVFAPTPRLVVVAQGTIPDGTLRGMLQGNRGEKSIVERMGPLGKQVSRGTYWGFALIEGNLNKPPPPKKDEGGVEGGENAVKQVAADNTGSAKGYGFKVTVGSRSMRMEAVVWHRDSEAARGMYEKFRDSTLAKGDEEEPPKWWKVYVQKLGDRKVGNELLSNVGGKSSGELFILYSQVETKLTLNSVGSIATATVGDPSRAQ